MDRIKLKQLLGKKSSATFRSLLYPIVKAISIEARYKLEC